MIYIIIPVFNRKALTRQCLRSLALQTYDEFQIVVVDDGSTDGTSEMLSKEFPEVNVLSGDGNFWWTKCMNAGVNFALSHQADYVLSLNNDTICPDTFLENMIFWADQKPSALIGALGVDAATQKIVYGGQKIRWHRAGYENILDTIPESSRKGLYEVTHFPGRGLLIPSEVFNIVGLFDEVHFPHYVADIDFTQRAIRHGFKVYINYDAPLLIFPDISSGNALRQHRTLGNYWRHLFSIKGKANLREFFIYAFRHCPKKYLVPYLLIGFLRRILGYWKPGNFFHKKSAFERGDPKK